MPHLFLTDPHDTKSILLAAILLGVTGAVAFIVGLYLSVIVEVLGSMLFGFGVGLFVEWKHEKNRENWKCPICGYNCDGGCGS